MDPNLPEICAEGRFDLELNLRIQELPAALELSIADSMLQLGAAPS
jgi:hypothetical protein